MVLVSKLPGHAMSWAPHGVPARRHACMQAIHTHPQPVPAVSKKSTSGNEHSRAPTERHSASAKLWLTLAKQLQANSVSHVSNFVISISNIISSVSSVSSVKGTHQVAYDWIVGS